MNSFVCPIKSPSALNDWIVAIAAPIVSVGRIIEQIGNFRSRNGVGSGIIRFARRVSTVEAVRSTNVTVELLIGSNTVSGGKPAWALPA